MNRLNKLFLVAGLVVLTSVSVNNAWSLNYQPETPLMASEVQHNYEVKQVNKNYFCKTAELANLKNVELKVNTDLRPKSVVLGSVLMTK